MTITLILHMIALPTTGETTRHMLRSWLGGGPFSVRYAQPIFHWFPRHLVTVIQLHTLWWSEFYFFVITGTSVDKWSVPYTKLVTATMVSGAVEEVAVDARMVMLLKCAEYIISLQYVLFQEFQTFVEIYNIYHSYH